MQSTRSTPSTNNHITCHPVSSPLYPQLITLDLLQVASPLSINCGSTDSNIRNNKSAVSTIRHDKSAVSNIRHTKSAVSTLNPSKVSLSQKSFSTSRSLSLPMAPLKFPVPSSECHSFPNQVPYFMITTQVKLSILCA